VPAAIKASLLFSALTDHAISCHWQYVYPVWSRRAQGISLGINLHPNRCCNWHCVYCQVPGLKRGPSPVIALGTLQVELEDCLNWISGWLAAHGEDQMRSLVQDVAFAGDGEPTTSPQFAEAMLLVIQTLNQRPPEDRPQRIRLITNGSQLQYAQVQRAIRRLQAEGGEVWFKLDAGNDAEMRAVNDSHLPLALHLQRLETCCTLCPTWIQTAVLNRRADGQVITTPTLDDYVQALDPLKHQVKGILLYGIARPSQQATADCMVPVSEKLLERYAEKLRAHGYIVRAFC
jgi:wyosine [tRNA(Phe)-imidazoG37] synthetase (radical SAM superfamily)